MYTVKYSSCEGDELVNQVHTFAVSRQVVMRDLGKPRELFAVDHNDDEH
jgi:hypothetical protein